MLSLQAEQLAAASPQEKSTTQGAAVSKVDACSLLTEGEIQSELGEALRGRKPSSQSAGGLRISQCVFVTSVPAKSVSLAVTTSVGPRGSVREFWQNTFHSQDTDRDSRIRNSPASKATAGPEAAESDTEESSAPRRIEGLGDEAYWVGNHITSALYILRGDRFVRLSVGGIPSESARLGKAKTLGAAALARL
jgi:hypothetical protein